MAARARSLADGHDRVYGAIVGEALPPPPPTADDWARVRHAERVLRELAAVVSYVADAEARSGYRESAAHYRRLWESAGEAITDLHRIGTGADTLPTSVLDDVRLGVDRLSATLDDLLRRVGDRGGSRVLIPTDALHMPSQGSDVLSDSEGAGQAAERRSFGRSSPPSHLRDAVNLLDRVRGEA